MNLLFNDIIAETFRIYLQHLMTTNVIHQYGTAGHIQHVLPVVIAHPGLSQIIAS